MSNQTSEYGGEEIKLDDTLDCTSYAKKMMSDGIKHMADDGKIDTMEAASMAITNAPAGLKAFIGRQNVDDEIKNLNEAEMKILAKEGLELARLAIELFSKKKTEE